MTSGHSPQRGRVLGWDSSSLWLSSGPVSLSSPPEGLRLGDWVEADGHSIRILTPNRRPDSKTPLFSRIQDPRRHRGVAMRQKVERAIRRYFDAQGFQETRTPILVPCPGMETHIRPFRLETGAYLPTSPEFALKRLLVGGLEKIYQIAPTFRLEPPSTTHSPEFTMLEWYRAFAGMKEIMADTEALIEALAIEVHGKPSIRFQGREFSVARPWPRLFIRDLFCEHAGMDWALCPERTQMAEHCRRLGLEVAPQDTWDDLYFRIWLNVVEPRLPQEQAVFVYGYPPSQAALAVIEQDSSGHRFARRFEAYAAGIELCNAFEELTDPIEQRTRFEKDMQARIDQYGDSFAPTPIDEGFLEALTEGMPPSGGNALGVDRLVMLLADEPDIRFTFWLEAFAGTD
jgi:lysyl-tRNA synthetase class 2